MAKKKDRKKKKNKKKDRREVEEIPVIEISRDDIRTEAPSDPQDPHHNGLWTQRSQYVLTTRIESTYPLGYANGFGHAPVNEMVYTYTYQSVGTPASVPFQYTYPTG